MSVYTPDRGRTLVVTHPEDLFHAMRFYAPREPEVARALARLFLSHLLKTGRRPRWLTPARLHTACTAARVDPERFDEELLK